MSQATQQSCAEPTMNTEEVQLSLTSIDKAMDAIGAVQEKFKQLEAQLEDIKTQMSCSNEPVSRTLASLQTQCLVADETLTTWLLKLDGISLYGSDIVRQRRKAVITAALVQSEALNLLKTQAAQLQASLPTPDEPQVRKNPATVATEEIAAVQVATAQGAISGETLEGNQAPKAKGIHKQNRQPANHTATSVKPAELGANQPKQSKPRRRSRRQRGVGEGNHCAQRHHQQHQGHWHQPRRKQFPQSHQRSSAKGSRPLPKSHQLQFGEPWAGFERLSLWDDSSFAR
eukprot:c15664_g1_i2.p1 GENE.c15664_g1_i2~~c15664_g1_i2.p1  ORF type:complete len:287 (+),score=52.77 c15664_g1_i2:77-937(+)